MQFKLKTNKYIQVFKSLVFNDVYKRKSKIKTIKAI